MVPSGFPGLNLYTAAMTDAASEPARSLDAAALFAELAAASNDPALAEISCRVGPSLDCVDALFAEERGAIERAIPKRQREFATARTYARTLLADRGLTPGPIPSDEHRAPRWPESVVGSISHTDALVWVAVCETRSGIRGLGIDVEQRHRLPSELHDKLFVASELEAVAKGGDDFATWLFSAKEAIYKATRPLAGAFIGFTEAECTMSSDGTFTVRYLGDHAPSGVMNQGRGYVRQDAEHVYALFMIQH